MDEATNQSATSTKSRDGAKIVSAVGGCAVATLAIGAFLGAAWPGAVVACAIALMGTVIAYFNRPR